MRGLLAAAHVGALKSLYDREYVTPASLVVYPGGDTSLEGAMLRRVCNLCVGGARVELSDAPLRAGLSAPHVARASGDGEIIGEGAIAICRFIGRLHRVHPLDPAAAVSVDSALELLGEVLTFLTVLENPARLFAPEADVAGQAAWFRTVYMPGVLWRLEALQERAMGESRSFAWIAGMDSESVADVCWASAMTWLHRHQYVDLGACTGLSYVSRWCALALGVDGGDSEGSEDGDASEVSDACSGDGRAEKDE